MVSALVTLFVSLQFSDNRGMVLSKLSGDGAHGISCTAKCSQSNSVLVCETTVAHTVRGEVVESGL